MNSSKVLLAAALAAVVSVLGPSSAAAQGKGTYPERPVRLIVPYAPGGVTDLVARQTAVYMEPHIAQHIVVENRAGASGALGTNAIAKAPPDGYTIGLLGMSATTLLPVVDSTLPYHPIRDIAPIGMITDNETIFIARPDFPASTLRELVALAKASPGKFFYGTAGAGGVSQLMVEDLKAKLDIQITNVPYQGDSQVITALVAKQLDLGFGALGSAASFVKNGQIKALAVGGATRSRTLPNVPTLRESGIEGAPVVNWSALGAPAGTPQPILNKLNDALNKALKQPKFLAWMEEQGLGPTGGNPEELTKSIRANMERFEAVVTALKLPRK